MASTDTSTGLRVWVVEGTPARYFSRCVCVGIGGKPARLTRKLIACCPVLSADVSTRRTGAGSVSTIDKRYRDSDKPALIGNLSLQIGKGPRVQDAAMRFVSPYPRSNVRQIFQRYSALRAFRNTDNLLGDSVVYVSNKSLLPSAQSPQYAPCGLRSFSLQSLALSPAAGANPGNLTGVSEGLAVRALGQIGKAKINPKPLDGLLLPFFRHVNRHIQEPLTFAKKQIAFPFWKLQQLSLSLATGKWQTLKPSADCPNAYGRGGQLEVQNTGIVGNAAVLTECPSRSPIQVVGKGHLANQQADNLCRQWKLVPNLAVRLSVKRKATKLLSFPSQPRNAVCGTVGGFQRFSQCLILFLIRQQFHLHGQFHII